MSSTMTSGHSSMALIEAWGQNLRAMADGSPAAMPSFALKKPSQRQGFKRTFSIR